MSPLDRNPAEKILHEMRDGMIVVDETHVVRYANPAAIRLLAGTMDELVDQPFVLSISEDEDIEVMLPTGTGLAIASSEFTWHDRPARLVTLRDITERKRIECERCHLDVKLDRLFCQEKMSRAETEHQRALLQAVLDRAPTMMCILQGPEHVFRYANHGCRATLGRTRAELIGKRILDVLPAIADGSILEILGRVYRTGETLRSVEMPLPIDVDRSGEPRDMYFTFVCQPMHDAGGRVESILLHAINVTESVEAQQVLAQQREEVACLNRELERRVVERTAELAAANRDLEAFAYSVSHDLRAPLRGIDGFSQALLEDCGDKLEEQGGRHLARIRSATQRMGEIIDDLLALSQVSRSNLQAEDVCLDTMVCEILDRLQERAPERRVKAIVAPEMRARGDEKLLRIALENLLGNAWKFTGKREQAIIEVGELASGSREGASGGGPGSEPATNAGGNAGGEPGGEQVFFVRDNGAGFDPAFKAKLFGTFDRLHSPADFPGTGIGLATVKRVIERHGGRIWAEGAVDQGAAFYFTLPV